jgi:hypothetical protein
LAFSALAGFLAFSAFAGFAGFSAFGGSGVLTVGSGAGPGPFGGDVAGFGRSGGFETDAWCLVGAEADEEVVLVRVGFDLDAGAFDEDSAGAGMRIVTSVEAGIDTGISVTFVSVHAVGLAGRSTTATSPSAGTDRTGTGGVPIRPKKAPTAKPTTTPTIDWTIFDNTTTASRVTPGVRL